MKSRSNELPDFDPTEVAFNVEAIRGFLFSAAMEVAEQFKEQGIAHGEAALLTAAIEFSTQLWSQVSLKAGVPKQTARKTLEKQVARFFQKHWDAEERKAPEVNPS